MREFLIEYTIDSIELENHSNFGYDFEREHSIVVSETTTISEIYDMIMETELEIMTDTPDYIDPVGIVTEYTITNIELREVIVNG